MKQITFLCSVTQKTLQAPHSGTSPTQAEVGNITRNVKIRGQSDSIQGFFDCQSTGVVDCDYVEFHRLGSATALRRGIDCNPTTGSASFEYCAMHDFIATGAISCLVSAAAANNITCSHNVFYNIQQYHTFVAATTGSNIVFDDNLYMLNVSTTQYLVNLADVGLTFTNNTLVSSAGSTAGTTAALQIAEAGAAIGTISGNTLHSNRVEGLAIRAIGMTGTISNTTVWRNTLPGIFVSTTTGNGSEITFDGVTAFGNGTANMYINPDGGSTGTPYCGIVRVNNGVFNAGVTLTSPIGIRLAGGTQRLELNSCTFGATTTHATGDIAINAANSFVEGRFNNCTFASTNELSTQANLSPNAVIGSSRHDQTNGNHKAWKRCGTISGDTSIYRTAAPSERLTPNGTSGKLQSSAKSIAIASGGTVTVNAYVYKSALYSGNQPRLIVLRNDAVGITSDTVLDTATAASEEAWEQLTGTTPTATDNGLIEVIVDCDDDIGDGFLCVDDWSAS